MNLHKVNVSITLSTTFEVEAEDKVSAFEAAQSLMFAVLYYGNVGELNTEITDVSLVKGDGDGPYQARQVNEVEREEGLSAVYKIINQGEG